MINIYVKNVLQAITYLPSKTLQSFVVHLCPLMNEKGMLDICTNFISSNGPLAQKESPHFRPGHNLHHSNKLHSTSNTTLFKGIPVAPQYVYFFTSIHFRQVFSLYFGPSLLSSVDRLMNEFQKSWIKTFDWIECFVTCLLWAIVQKKPMRVAGKNGKWISNGFLYGVD